MAAPDFEGPDPALDAVGSRLWRGGLCQCNANDASYHTHVDERPHACVRCVCLAWAPLLIGAIAGAGELDPDRAGRRVELVRAGTLPDLVPRINAALAQRWRRLERIFMPTRTAEDWQALILFERVSAAPDRAQVDQAVVQHLIEHSAHLRAYLETRKGTGYPSAAREYAKTTADVLAFLRGLL